MGNLVQILNQHTENFHLMLMNHHAYNTIIYTLKLFGTCVVIYLVYKVSRYAYFKFKRNFHKAAIEEGAAYNNKTYIMRLPK